jgi:hypothetical protein
MQLGSASLRRSSSTRSHKDLLKQVRGIKRHLTPSQVMELRSKWRPQFEKHIWETHSKGLRSDVIIRDMKRIDAYPDVDGREKGISPWFRLGLVGTYHRGILVAHSWGGLMADGDGWRGPNYAAGEKPEVKALLISNIPYENIEQVDWDGDEYYAYPHIYCWFGNKKSPYERTWIYTRTESTTGGLPFFTEIADPEDVRRRNLKRGYDRYFG